jgi:hypothetical protein
MLIQLFSHLEEEEEDRSPEGRALGAASAALYDDSSDASTILAARPRGAGAGAAPAPAPAAPAARTAEQEASGARVDELCQIIGSALAALAREIMGLPPREDE